MREAMYISLGDFENFPFFRIKADFVAFSAEVKWKRASHQQADSTVVADHLCASISCSSMIITLLIRH